MKEAKVLEINPNRDMYMVVTDDGTYTVFELLDSIDITPGDVLKGNWNSEGSQKIYKISSKEYADVIVQNAGCTLTHARSRMLN